MDSCPEERLHDSELAEATGGDLSALSGGWNVIKRVYDTRDRNCGKYINSTLYYWPCKKCGRPTHMGSGFYQCDKCDDWFWSVSDTRYNGTEEQLKSESAAN